MTVWLWHVGLILVVDLLMLMTNELIRMKCHHSMGESVLDVEHGEGVGGIDARGSYHCVIDKRTFLNGMSMI